MLKSYIKRQEATQVVIKTLCLPATQILTYISTENI